MTPDILDIALTMMEELDCPRSLSVAILLRHGEWRQIAEMATDPRHYLTAHAYMCAVQASDLLRKVEDLDTGIDREVNTFQAWVASERACYSTNERLSPLLSSPLRRTENRSIDNFVLRARELIRSWLGRVPDWLEPRFGPGATCSDKSIACLVPDKLTSIPTSTADCDFLRPLWEETAWCRALRGLGRQDWETVRGNIYFTVPKDGKVFRACGKSPSINVAYQLAVGKRIRGRLKRIGIDLDDGQDTHMRVACAASIDGSYASIDLRSASDRVASALVELLLPPEWFDLLKWLREPFTYIPAKGRWWRLEKFSAMGNGFTFELETLLFLALVCAVDESLTPGLNAFVYGDDILCPTEFSKDVLAALKYFGFEPNERKTFTEGPFRESCGGDYWLGCPVRAFHLESLPRKPADWIAMANGIRRVAEASGLSLRRTWFKVLDQIPRNIRALRGPVELGDTVIHDVQSKWITRVNESIRYILCYCPNRTLNAYWWGYNYDVQMASILYGVAWSDVSTSGHDDERFLVLRDGVVSYAPRWVPFS